MAGKGTGRLWPHELDQDAAASAGETLRRTWLGGESAEANEAMRRHALNLAEIAIITYLEHKSKSE